ncbi:aminotransferase class I/II-fold pyridoxal phosphate-dependent enzyme [Paenibacillus nanensis]|nr:aminotransferase class I/II-fold pyridoxal phosphate-dependent enzyme [Paenibacillus nanensis]
MSGREREYIAEAFDSNWIAPLGPHLDAFEAEMASYVGVAGAAAVSSGTAAIHLALRLLGVTAGDSVFCQSFTFVATANPIRYLGAEPVFIDSEPDTWNMSPAALERALADKEREGRLPKAVIVVHLYGGMSRMEELVTVCDRYGVPLIEDAAESLGSTYRGRHSGTFGRFGIYSFNGNKIITTSGGGMLVSNDAEALGTARFLATQGRDPAPYYQHSQMGYNYRMSNLLAGVGRAQLEVLEERVAARREVYLRYAGSLGDVADIAFMPELPGTRSNRWLTAMTIERENAEFLRDSLLAELAEANIEARPLWKPLHMQPLFAEASFYAHQPGRGSVCGELFRKGLCLPSGSSLTEADQQRVISVIRNVLLPAIDETLAV